MSELVIRSPSSGEIERAVYLFRNSLLRPQSRILVALRNYPIPRIIAAVAWWKEGNVARFQLANQSHALHWKTIELLIEQVENCAQAVKVQKLQYADLLANGDIYHQILTENGFGPMNANRFFEVNYCDAWNRVATLFKLHHKSIPSAWRTESIRFHDPTLVADLVGKHGLLPPAELLCYWQANCLGGFERDASSILFADRFPIGVLLVRENQNAFFVDVRVVSENNKRLRALGNLLLFQHMAQRFDPREHITRIQFHGGEVEHQETANLAFRMKGRELPSRYILVKKL